MNELSVYLVSVLIIIILLFIFIDATRRPANFPPGPKFLPIVGNSPLLKHLTILHGGFHKALIHLADEYNTDILGLKLGRELFIVVFSKDLIRQAFLKNELQARPDNYFIKLRTMGSRRGITMTDGDMWREQRNFAVRHLHSLGLGKSQMESLIVEELQDLIKRLQVGEKTILFNNLLAPCVLNVLWAITAGSRFNPSDAQLTRLLELMGARSKAFDMAGGVLGQLPFLSYLAPEWSGYNLICSLNNELKTFLEKSIETHKQNLDLSNARDFIDVFLKEINISNGPSTSFTEEQLVMVCLDFFIAGSQTTSNTLNFAFLHMVLHQDVQEQVYREIKDVFGERNIPKLEDRKRLPFVEAVLLESQRLLHVAPVVGPRRAICDTTLNKYFIPKNTTILSCLYSIHHDTSLWVDPEKFCPNRFLREDCQKLVEEMYLFGYGKRRCLGEALAKSFIFLFFTGILRNFHLGIQNSNDLPKFEYIPGITLSPKPYHVYLTPRLS